MTLKPETRNADEVQGQAHDQGPAKEDRIKSRRQAGKGKEGVLTPKQEAFAFAYVETSNASEAYRRAYDASNTQDHVVWVKACELLKHGKVKVRIAEIQAENAQRNAVTVDTITEMLRQDRELARQEKQSSAAIQAALGLAKLHGLVIDKSSNENRNTGTLSVRWAE